MTTAIKRRRGTTTQHSTFTGLEGEITVDSTKDTVVVHDGSTAGGFALLREDLSNNTNVITTTNTKTLTNKTFGDNPTFSAGTANGVAYLNGSKVLTTGSALTFDGSNLGLGVTPSAWHPDYRAYQLTGGGALFNNGGNNFLSLSQNLFVNSSLVNTYIASAAATRYRQNAGAHIWDNAPSGTAGNAISFTQAMTLDASGNLGIGTSSPSYKLHLSTTSAGDIETGVTNSVGLSRFGTRGSGNSFAGSFTAGKALELWSAGSLNATIDSSGNLQVSNLAGTGNRAVYSTSTGILTNSSSDRSLKENDTPISQGLDAVLAMRPISYEWIDKEKMGAQREIGFIAQEMQQIVPEVVGSNSDETLSIDYPKLVAVMAKAIQELTARVTALETK